MKRNVNKVTRGFTLIELIVVIAILVTLGLILVPSVSGYIEGSQKTVCLNNVNLVQRSFLAQKATNENISISAVILNEGGKYFSGNAECPKEHVLYSTYIGNVFCPYHKITTSGNLSEYDVYIIDNMEKLLQELGNCNNDGECIKNILGVRYLNNDHMREYLFKQNGNKWDIIEEEILKKASLEGTYYYQPFYTQGTQVEILFASKNGTLEKNWNSDLFYFEGKWYKKNKEFTFSIPSLNQKSVDYVRDQFNNKNQFTVIN